MISRSGIYLLVAALFAGLPAVCMPLHVAHAQDAEDPEAEAEAAESAKKAEARRAAKAAAPPAALPGAESREEEHGHANSDMNPTNALFDAINRGSLGAAKEALNRGADMTAQNQLGQTPLDMAIDLNRNDITFLLLSMRTFSDADPHFASNNLESGEDDTPPLTMPKHASTTASPDRRYDASGGHADPSIGFLGFGGS